MRFVFLSPSNCFFFSSIFWIFLKTSSTHWDPKIGNLSLKFFMQLTSRILSLFHCKNKKRAFFCKIKTTELECAPYTLQALQKVAFVSQQVNVTLIVLTCYQLHGAVLLCKCQNIFFSLIYFLCNDDIKNKINCTPRVFRT